MGCGSSTSAKSYHYKRNKALKVRTSIKRRESFIQANTILVNRVAQRMHEQWRSSRVQNNDTEDRSNETGDNQFLPCFEVIGQAKVDIANLTWEELPESVKAKKLRAIGVCSDAVISKLRDQHISNNDVSFFKKRRESITIDSKLLDTIAELEYMLSDDPNLLPWKTLTDSEKSEHHHTTLCVISEWNEMMKEAEIELAEKSLPKQMVQSQVVRDDFNDHINDNKHIKSLSSESKSLTHTKSLSSSTSSFSSIDSKRNISTRKRMTRVLSGRDVLKEIRQTIRVSSISNQSDGMVPKKRNSARQRMRWAAMRVAESTRAHLRKQIRKNKHFVRVFVSSTFRDFHAERDYLFQRIFPRLESACAEVGILFIPVDLRWGVTTQEALDGQVIKLCLQEVDTCRPFFVAMLGERYGWHVDPSASTLSDGDQLLKKTFDVASVTFPFVKKWRDRSATEIEIRHAVLNNPKQKMQSFFFLRDPKSKIVSDAIALGNANGENMIETFQSESEHAKRLQNQLKDSIRKVKSSQHRVTDGYSSLEELGKILFEQLKDAIEQETNRNDMSSVVSKVMTDDQPLDAAHASSAETERLVFVRNEAVAQAFRHAYVKDMEHFSHIEQLCGNSTEGNAPLAIVGGPGLGKSALLANLSESSAPQLTDTIMAVLYIGSQYQSPTVSEVVIDIVHLVRREIQQLRNRLRKNQ
jgi:hypothetical protein